jgi:hypothetical protein
MSKLGIVVEIGRRDQLSHEDAKRGADRWDKARRNNPDVVLMFTLGGYDDDPRAIWEIPEAAAYMRTWAQLVGLDDPEHAERAFGSADERTVGATLGLLDMCGVFDEKPLFTRGEQLN